MAKENVILCCLAERPELGQAMTQEQAQELVNDNYDQWSEFHPSDGPPPPPGELMPRFSKTSLSKLETCHPVLQDLMHEVIRFFDIKVIEGYRSNERQESLHFAGKKQK